MFHYFALLSLYARTIYIYILGLVCCVYALKKFLGIIHFNSIIIKKKTKTKLKNKDAQISAQLSSWVRVEREREYVNVSRFAYVRISNKMLGRRPWYEERLAALDPRHTYTQNMLKNMKNQRQPYRFVSVNAVNIYIYICVYTLGWGLTLSK